MPGRGRQGNSKGGTRKGEKGCTSLWCRSKSRWYQGREGKKERRKHSHTHTHRKYIATEGVKPVKRKGSDQRRDEAMGEEEGGTRGRVGGTVEATRPLSTVKLYCFVHYLYLWECFSFMSSSPSFFFFCLADAHTHTHAPTHKQTVTTFHTSSAAARQRKHGGGHERCGHTAPHSYALLSRP